MNFGADGAGRARLRVGGIAGRLRKVRFEVRGVAKPGYRAWFGTRRSVVQIHSPRPLSQFGFLEILRSSSIPARTQPLVVSFAVLRTGKSTRPDHSA